MVHTLHLFTCLSNKLSGFFALSPLPPPLGSSRLDFGTSSEVTSTNQLIARAISHNIVSSHGREETPGGSLATLVQMLRQKTVMSSPTKQVSVRRLPPLPNQVSLRQNSERERVCRREHKRVTQSEAQYFTRSGLIELQRHAYIVA